MLRGIFKNAKLSQTLFLCQALAEKAEKLLVKTVQAKAIQAAQALTSFCPANLQSPKMAQTSEMVRSTPGFCLCWPLQHANSPTLKS